MNTDSNGLWIKPCRHHSAKEWWKPFEMKGCNGSFERDFFSNALNKRVMLWTTYKDTVGGTGPKCHPPDRKVHVCPISNIHGCIDMRQLFQSWICEDHLAALDGCCFPGARGQYSLQLQTNNRKQKYKTKGVTKNKGLSQTRRKRGRNLKSHILQFEFFLFSVF